jgi:16S rRNA (uracil1498-N3)-methyltransferase
MKVNDDVFIFDGKAHEYRCQIQAISKGKVSLLIKEEIKNRIQRTINLVIACALPRQKSRFDDLVDKLSQLGVNKIIPMITSRVIVRWGSIQRQRHYQRWCKIAQQACAQSGRNTLPIIEPIKGIKQILSCDESYDLKLISTLIEKKQNLKGILFKSLPKSILVLIGPEGDFTKQELNQANAAGFTPVFLGDLVLRVDTAAIAVAAFFRLQENIKSTTENTEESLRAL